MTQWAAIGVSVFEFRGVTSKVIFQDSTPMFAAMSIAFSDFTFCSQVYSCKRFSKSVLRIPILCLLHRNFWGYPSSLFGYAKGRDYSQPLHEYSILGSYFTTFKSKFMMILADTSGMGTDINACVTLSPMQWSTCFSIPWYPCPFKKQQIDSLPLALHGCFFWIC